jgi:hypothetical protein
MQIIERMHEAGVRSEHAYTAAVGSIGLAFASWLGSLKAEPHSGVDRADRWGIFVGEWAPTFMALGVALAQYENGNGSKAHSHTQRLHRHS